MTIAAPELARRKRRADEMRGSRERREVLASGLEMREAADGTLHLRGYASVTGVAYEVGYYTETIKQGAFKRTLSENPDCQLLVNHAGLPLARTLSGTMTLSEDSHGLLVDASLDGEDPDVQSLARKMRRGDIDNMSFAFQVTDDSWNDDYTARAIRSLSLHRGDVSVVNQGANPAATATVRAHQQVTLLPDFTSRARQEFDALLIRAGRTPRAAGRTSPSVPARSQWYRDRMAELSPTSPDRSRGSDGR